MSLVHISRTYTNARNAVIDFNIDQERMKGWERLSSDLGLVTRIIPLQGAQNSFLLFPRLKFAGSL